MNHHHIHRLEGYHIASAGCVDLVRPDGHSAVYLSRLPDGRVIVMDDQDHIEMHVMPGIQGASGRIAALKVIADEHGLSLSNHGALVAICCPKQVDDTVSRFAHAKRQIEHLDVPLAA